MPSGNLKDHGDQFERAHHKWIGEYLPGYESLWQKYVGNNGQNRPLELAGLTDEEREARKLFFQSHYSLAVYAHLFERHADAAINALEKSVEENTHREISSHLREMQNFTLFVALLGQACDMVESIAKALKDSQIADKIAAVFTQRNNAIHSGRIPVAHDPYGVLIAPIARVGSDPGVWHKFATWDSVERKDFIYLKDWLSGTRDEFFTVMRNPIYPMIGKAAVKRFRNQVTWPKEDWPSTFTGLPGYSYSGPLPNESEMPHRKNDGTNEIRVNPSGDGRG